MHEYKINNTTRIFPDDFNIVSTIDKFKLLKNKFQ